jgi:outer membrane protein
MTRKLTTIIFAVFVLALAAVAQAPAANAAPAAAGPAPTKIGIINIQAAIMATNEGQRDFQGLEKKFDPKRNELQTANNDVENLKKQLNTQGEHLNDAARADLVKNIESKQKVLQRNLEDAQAEWTNQQNDIANRIGGKMLEVLEKYANDNGYAVVLDVSSQGSPVLWANAATNITKFVVDAYNAQSNVPAPAPGTTPTAPKPVAPTTKPAAPTTAITPTKK